MPNSLTLRLRTELTLAVNCGDTTLPGNPEYYLSKPVSAADFNGLTQLVDGTTQYTFQDQGNGQVSAQDQTTAFSYSDTTYEAIELSDSNSRSLFVLLSGTIENGVLTRWDYNQDDRFISVAYYRTENGQATTLGQHERE